MHGKVVIWFAGKLWFEVGQSTTVWRIDSETPYGEMTRARIWHFRSDATKMGSSARRLGPTGLAARSAFRHKNTTAKASAWPFGPRHSSLSAPLHENTTQMWARPVGLAFSPSQMHQAPIFRPLDVSLAVSDMLCSTLTTLSVYG